MIDQRLPNAAEMLGKSTRQAVLYNLGARYSSRDLASGAGMAQSLCSEAGIRGIPVHRRLTPQIGVGMYEPHRAQSGQANERTQ
jgi:hypothetical protein